MLNQLEDANIPQRKYLEHYCNAIYALLNQLGSIRSLEMVKLNSKIPYKQRLR